jgi:hypothetical protein
LGFRQKLLQVLFDEVWVVRSSQAKSLRHAFHVGIDDNTGPAKGMTENHIRGLSADTRQGDQFFHRVWDPSSKTLGHGLPAGNKMFRFVLEETSGTNELFEFRKIRRSQLCWSPIMLKE